MEKYFIINPVSGKGEAVKFIPEIREAGEHHIHVTEAVGEAESFSRKIASMGNDVRFYAVGGDGTLNEIINGVKGYKNAQVGLIPSGTGNDFVRCFENRDLFRNINAQVNGRVVEFDTVQASFDNGYVCDFINMANVGFDCNVVINTNTIKKKYASGSFAYLLGAVQELLAKWGNEIKITFDDGEVYENTQLLCTIANGRYCGGGFCSSPHAMLSDGLIDVAVVSKLSKPQLIKMLGAYRNGTYLDTPMAKKFVKYKQTTGLKVELGERQGISIDGEIYYFKSAEFKINRHSLKFVLPEGAGLN